ncbi:hypothetical protein LINPERHAP1_LOCUS14459 [Linum perenne]
MQEDVVSNPRCPQIPFSEEEIKSFYQPWSKALVIKVLEKSFSFGAIKRRLEYLWSKNETIQVSDVSNAFFLVRFSDQDDYKRAAFNGPWKMAVSRIGNCIGKTVQIDLATTEGARARYARVCVEVDISKPLLGKYMIEDRTFYIEYESLDNICFSCGFYGHKADACKFEESPDPEATQAEPVNHPVDTSKPEGDTGEWMTVQRRNRGKTGKDNKSSSKTPNDGSRYNVLLHDESLNSRPAEELFRSKTSVKASTSKGKNAELDARSVEQACKLASILTAATHLNSGTSNSEEVKTSTAAKGQTLTDVTNMPRSKINSKKPLGSVPTSDLEASKILVSVPVAYHNLIFQVDPESVQKPVFKKAIVKKSKPVTKIPKANVKTPLDNSAGKKPRTFVSKKPQLNISSSDPIKAGKPPDNV